MYNVENLTHEVLPAFFPVEPISSPDVARRLPTTAVVLSPSTGNTLLEAMIRSGRPFMASRMGLGTEPIACHVHLEHLSYK